MSSDRIRATSESDLEAIRLLLAQAFPDFAEDELRWLLADPRSPGALRSFVAIAKGRIVGHIGYIDHYYHHGGSRFRGVHPILWAMDPACRGTEGIELMAAVLSGADFSVGLGPADVAIKLSLMLGYRQVGEAGLFLRVLSPIAFLSTLEGSRRERLERTLRLTWRSLRTGLPSTSSVILESYVPATGKREPDPGVLVNEAGPEALRWLADCPLRKCHLFSVAIDGEIVGPACCYVRRYPTGAATGRIVHLPFLGTDVSLWRKVLASLEVFLRAQGCCAISLLATYPPLRSAVGTLGYAADSCPVLLRDRKHLLGEEVDLHLTYLEGDLGYRNM